MPTTPKSNRREPEKNRKNRLSERPSSFHGKLPVEIAEARIRRPKTDPDLLAGRNLAFSEMKLPKLTKLLLNVTIQGSVGTVQVLMSPENTVGDLISAALRQHIKDGRRPKITADSSSFDLHYSQFSLESLDREEKLAALGSRNFFLCPKKAVKDGAENSSGGCDSVTATASSCSKEAGNTAKSGFAWLKFMDFLL